LALNGYSNAQPAETMAHNLAAAAVGISPTAYARPNHAQDEPLAQNLIIGVLKEREKERYYYFPSTKCFNPKTQSTNKKKRIRTRKRQQQRTPGSRSGLRAA
jgi:hypothetical protein